MTLNAFDIIVCNVFKNTSLYHVKDRHGIDRDGVLRDDLQRDEIVIR